MSVGSLNNSRSYVFAGSETIYSYQFHRLNLSCRSNRIISESCFFNKVWINDILTCYKKSCFLPSCFVDRNTLRAGRLSPFDTVPVTWPYQWCETKDDPAFLCMLEGFVGASKHSYCCLEKRTANRSNILILLLKAMHTMSVRWPASISITHAKASVSIDMVRLSDSANQSWQMVMMKWSMRTNHWILFRMLLVG